MKLLVCESCEAEFQIKHSMDENYYRVIHCPFCGEEHENIEVDPHIENEDWD